MDQIETLISESPHFHAWPDGRPANWSVAPDVLRFIHGSLKPSMRTLETGAGQTTVAFAIAGTHHVCITPDEVQAERIRNYCSVHGIKDTITFIHKSSDVALASGEGIPDSIDFVLIDGAHRFPFPILDWHFTQQRVPAGGIVAVDDYLMPSVRILYDFLIGEEEWELVKMFQVTSFFRRKRKTLNLSDWADQRINASHVDKLGQELEGRKREVEKLEREIQETRAELRDIKNSRVWRLYQSIRPMVVGVKRVNSGFRMGPRNRAEGSDGPD